MTHSPTNKTLNELAQEMKSWAENAVPQDQNTVYEILNHLEREIAELRDSMVAYDEPVDWGLSKPVTEGRRRRLNVAYELGDCFILLLRFAAQLNIDPNEAISDKWAIVQKRNYRKLESESSTNVKQSIDNQQTFDYVICEQIGIEFEPRYVSLGTKDFVWKNKRNSAFGFNTEAAAASFVQSGFIGHEPLRSIPHVQIVKRWLGEVRP